MFKFGTIRFNVGIKEKNFLDQSVCPIWVYSGYERKYMDSNGHCVVIIEKFDRDTRTIEEQAIPVAYKGLYRRSAYYTMRKELILLYKEEI